MSKRAISILADENILGLERYFLNSADIEFDIKKKAGRSIKNADLNDCDILLVRSVTQVNEALLQGSSVRFVGTATSGVEHVNQNLLEDKGIYFSDAKGANANAVSEYIIASLAYLSLRNQCNYFKKKIAIVGHGFVGRALEKKLQAFGADLIIYDPILQTQSSLQSESQQNLYNYCEWNEVVDSDVISFHVPYTESGEFPTKNLLDEFFIENIKSDCVLLNAARGEICDEAALLKKISESDIKTVLDVWDKEPDISEKLLEAVDIASPHIAGYSLDAKLNATKILAEQVFNYFKLEKIASNQAVKDEKIYLTHATSVENIFDVCELILKAYNPSVDSLGLRSKGDASLKTHFDLLRKNYVHRNEWSHFNVSQLKINSESKTLLKNIGFSVE